jgi:hypothetical protein
VMAAVFALVAGRFRIATRLIERMIARVVRVVWAMWKWSFWVGSKERSEEGRVMFGLVEWTIALP